MGLHKRIIRYYRIGRQRRRTHPKVPFRRLQSRSYPVGKTLTIPTSQEWTDGTISTIRKRARSSTHRPASGPIVSDPLGAIHEFESTGDTRDLSASYSCGFRAR